MDAKDEPNDPGAAVEKAYFNLLANELKSAGNADAIPFLGDILKLRLERPNSAPGPRPFNLVLSQKLSDYSIRLNGVTGETISWYLDFLAANGGRETPPEKALQTAGQLAQPPADAKCVISEYDATSGRVFFRARWVHELNGIPIEGDFMEVLVNGTADKAFSYTRHWRSPDLTFQESER